MRVTRQDLLAGAAAGALTAAGVYELVDRLVGDAETFRRVTRFPEQHIVRQRLVVDNDVEVVVPALHHQLVTATVRVPERARALRDAQRELEQSLRRLEREFEQTQTDLGVVLGWGLPYFRRYVRALADRHIPIDLRASKAKGKEVRAVLDAVRFPSDPPDVLLEEHEVAILLRSDEREHVAAGARALFDELDVFEVTTIRKGFAGGGFEGRQSLPKRMAMAAGVSGADLIPDTAELFLGFTSSQRQGQGPERIANFETLKLTDLGPAGYFRRGTAMSVSHIFEDLAAWYLIFDFAERVETTFRPGLEVPEGTQTVRQAPEDVTFAPQVARDFERTGRIGHSSAIQAASRLQEDVRGADGTLYRKGTAIPHRADFNTLDNPFFWTARPQIDRFQDTPSPGVHFVAFTPTSDDFNRTRLAMDGVLPDGTKLPFERQSRGQGFNTVLTTTHRQNFLVPPRRHRSFPLVELLR